MPRGRFWDIIRSIISLKSPTSSLPLFCLLNPVPFSRFPAEYPGLFFHKIFPSSIWGVARFRQSSPSVWYKPYRRPAAEGRIMSMPDMVEICSSRSRRFRSPLSVRRPMQINLCPGIRHSRSPRKSVYICQRTENRKVGHISDPVMAAHGSRDQAA